LLGKPLWQLVKEFHHLLWQLVQLKTLPIGSIFLAQNVIGFGTTVGSAVFNILFVIGVVNILSSFSSGQPPRDPNPTQADYHPQLG
jgi:Ca2+/Na+ antiporter